MSSISGRRHNGMRQRVRDYFAANPSEILTHADGAAKFGCTQRQFGQIIEHLRREGLVESGWVTWANPTRSLGI